MQPASPHAINDLQRIRVHRVEAAPGEILGPGTSSGVPGRSQWKPGGPLCLRRRLAILTGGPDIAAVVRAATWNGARLLGLADRGRLQPGYRADFIAIKGPPDDLLSGLSDPTAVFVEGKHLQPSKP